MKYVIYFRGCRTIAPLQTLDDIPDVKAIRFVGRYLHYNSDGKLISLRYALYFPNGTYVVELPRQEDWTKFQAYLSGKFKTAGVKPKMATGTVQGFKG